MPKKMLIDATHAEETRVVVVDGNKVEEFDFESENKRQLAGNIYLAKVTRVEPSLQAAFVDYGGNRHGFLAFSEVHPDYYQIPVADREALMEEERAYAEAMKAKDEEDEKPKRRPRSRSRSKSKAEKTQAGDAVVATDVVDSEISGMETIDLDDDPDEAGATEGLSPMETVAETPVVEPETEDSQDETAVENQVEDEVAPSGNDAGNDLDDEDEPGTADASIKDDSIESVAEEDDSEDIRPVRKPRPRRYKIQEVIKVRQILLVQVVKEERGNKGAALTTYLSLAGRYCVLMPNTARGGGISRKITNAVDRKKLKEIANEIDVPQGAGLIVRTAGAKRTKSEIKRDYEYLQRMWEQIRELTLKSIAPAKIYEEGDLIKRSIRDLYNREIDEVLVEGERGYRIAKDFMKMIMPSHAKNVKHYSESMPLFARHQVESYLSGMFNPTVQLKSGGYIVIGVTEALVAIDVNSGRATKEGSIEETATKTNLEAAEEVARQLRLRDLAGLIVIDFIDMDERRNNAAVEKRMKDKLKTDRARIQVGRISGFGLMEMSRQRLRPGMIEATTQPCPACHGTGLIRSDDNMALSILRQIEEEGVRRRSREVLVKCPVSIANFLMNQKREHVAQIEARYGLSVRIEGDTMLVSPDFTLEKFKTATRAVPEATMPVVSVNSSLMDDVDAEADLEEEVEADVSAVSDNAEDETKPKKRRRRRRRRSKSSGAENGAEADSADDTEAQDGDSSASESTEAAPEETTVAEPETAAEAETEEPKSKPKRTRRPRKKAEQPEVVAGADATSAGTQDAEAEDSSARALAATEEAPEEAPKKRPRRSRAKKKEPELTTETATVEASDAPDATPVKADGAAETQEEPVQQNIEVEAAEVTEQTESANEVAAEPKAAELPEDPSKPKRRGWWSLAR
ncbi:Ribonuclease E [Roseovarius litorisediminis]|uniref:Ribonuclease E n=1 Tax=Roseovarius litorisediminis TaxID=1312363 RepID=A0A1Y5TEQ8_9RHOB|nr:ribonuclease E/G [Roseovarius litorisediminis]SLN62584.1 Ribonuclease E [Roseovarius litorisediminis]